MMLPFNRLDAYPQKETAGRLVGTRRKDDCVATQFFACEIKGSGPP
jgi:hypothetical protein